MKKLLLLFALFTGFAAAAQVNHTDQKGQKQGKWVKTYESGKKRYEGYFKNNIPVGTFTYYFEREGGIMSEMGRCRHRYCSTAMAALGGMG